MRAFWSSFFPKSCLNVWGAAYTRVRLIHECGLYTSLYGTSDGSKTHAPNQYLVVSVDGLWCSTRKFTGSQLRSTSYRIKLSECYHALDVTEVTANLSRRYSTDSYPENIDQEPACIPMPQSTPNPAPALVLSEFATPPDL